MEWPSRCLISCCQHAGQPQVLGGMVASFREFRAGLEPGVKYSPEGRLLQIRTRGGGLLCDQTH